MELGPIPLRACTVDPIKAEVVRPGSPPDHLSPRELELLLYLRAHPDRTVPREELLVEVWHYAPSVVSRAVDTTVRRLREKIEADPQQPDHLLTAFGEGYRFVALVADASLPDVPEADPFVGRGDEVRRLAGALLRPGAAILILGPPGAGKTRLARHLAHRMAHALRGGSLLVDLTDARDLPEVALALADALEIETGGTGAAVLRQAGEALRGRGACLVTLDNCEGVRAAAGEAIAALRGAAPDARFLVTSRERLTGADDTVQLGALALAEAVALFEVLAQRVRPDFAVGAGRPVVEALVERLERLPLAIALAAGRVHALSPKAILERLDDRFRVLASRGGSGDLRHPTLRAALDGSWDLLGPVEREVLVTCSAFRGGFDLAAAAAVVGAPDTAEILARLCARSLLEPRGARFGGYAFVREYASERLAADPVIEDRVFRAHAAWFAGIGHHDVQRLLVEQTNLVAATERAAARGWADLVGPLALAALEGIARRGPFELGAALARASRDVPGLDWALAAKLGARLAMLQHWTATGDPLATIEQAYALARDHDDPALLGETLRVRAILARSRGETLASLAGLDQALALVRQRGEPAALAAMLCTLGSTLRSADRLAEARACWEEVAAMTGERSHLANALGNLALLERRAGRFDAARTLYRRVLDHKLGDGDRRGEATARMGVASVDLDQGHWEAALAEYHLAQRLVVELGTRQLEASVQGNLGLCLRGLGRPDEARAYFEQAAGLFDRLGEPGQAAVARGNLAALDLEEGDADLALAGLTRSVAVLTSQHDRRAATDLRCVLGEALLALGRVDEAAAVAAPVEASARAGGDPNLLARALAVRGRVEVARGQDPGATLAEAEALAAGTRPDSEVGRALTRLRDLIPR